MSARLQGRERILVRAPSWLGDFVAAEPSIRALCERAERAGAENAVAVSAPAGLLALLDGRFPRLQLLPIDPGRPEATASFRERDVAILLNGSFRSAWLAWRAGVAVRAGLGRGPRSTLLTHALTPPREAGGTPLGIGRAGRAPRFLPRPFGSTCAELLAWLGVPVHDRRPRILASDRARERAEARLARAGLSRGEPFVLANAGARPGSAKGFPPECFAAVLDALARRSPMPVVIACAPGEEAAARETASRAALARTVLLDDPPSDLVELAALAAAAKLAIGPDNGARHVAEALGTPCVVFCGPTDPRHVAEHPATTHLFSVQVPCGPCHREICPLAGDRRHACMRRIDAARVAETAALLLG